MNKFRALLTVAAASAAITVQAHASIVFLHSGNIDPTTEGWIVEPVALVLGERPTAGPVSNDQGSGIDAWSIDDNSTIFLGTNWFYTRSPTTSDSSQANTFGWTLRGRLRVGDTPDSVGNAGSIILGYANGVTDFGLALGSDADGDPIALLWDGGVDGSGLNATGTTVILQNSGSGYHLYEMVYDPFTKTVDLFIDGVERASNYAGVTSSSFNRVSWGSANSSDTGQSNWNQVEWEIVAVPLPAALPLFLSGLFGLG